MWRLTLLRFIAALVVGGLTLATPASAQAQSESDSSDSELIVLAGEFNAWLASNQPATRFASLRIERPAEWKSDWSRTAIQELRVEYLHFQGRLKSLDVTGFDVGDHVDAAMLGAATTAKTRVASPISPTALFRPVRAFIDHTPFGRAASRSVRKYKCLRVSRPPF